MKKMMGYIQLLVVLLGLWLLIGGTVANAQETIFVEDNAGILTAEDKQYIHDLNETTFKALEGEPQYVVVTLKRLEGESIESFAEKKFQELGIGNKEVDNGFLFVISLEDREFRLETGYGVEAVITDGMKDDVISSRVKDYLEDEQYAQGVMAITKNIEGLVIERYGNYAASVKAIQDRRAQNQKILQIVLICLAILGLVILLSILIYMGRKKRIQGQFETYVSPKLSVKVFRRANSGLDLSQLTGDTSSYRNYRLSKVAATKTMRHGNSGALAKDATYLTNTIATYLVEDAVIDYWLNHRKGTKYELAIYMEASDIQVLVTAYGSQLFTSGLLEKNPFRSSQGHHLLEPHMAETTVKHEQALAVSTRNQQIVKEASTAYIEAKGVSFKDGVDRKLMIALMTYFLLEGRSLADENDVTPHLLSQKSLDKVYDKAKRKRRSIESSYRRQALSDLDQMVIGSYYMQQSMMWSSYSSSSDSGSSSGGSSFGGGSSGGGGFSGGW